MTSAEKQIFQNRSCGYDPYGSAEVHRAFVCCPDYGDFLPDFCGQGPPVYRIAAGKEAQPNSYPWMAMLLYKNTLYSGQNLVPKCAGSLITNRYVLTAAHCVHVSGFQLKSVRLGEHNISSNPDHIIQELYAPPHLEINVEQIIKHEEFHNVDNRKYYNDIALLRLEIIVRYTRQIIPICILTGQESFDPYPFLINSTLHIAGWGYSHMQEFSKILLEAKIKIRNPDECFRKYPFLGLNKESQICAGNDGKDTCEGDSGSPLMAPMRWGENEFVYLAGITSYGGSFDRTCGYGPAAYTKTSKFLDWIRRNMFKLEPNINFF
ncbi:spaetzle-processing enzyme [Drosophila takahashii]|uniref:spaetzle-processing enzyme n=1 Tax=Drosophila takahashii TaxID=29030 RepID=UPI001CF85D35|nr:spaetzle-processing enzyme [Drosophila takahashii]